MRRDTYETCVDCGATKDKNEGRRCNSCARKRVHRARRLREMHDVVRRIVAATHMVRSYVEKPEPHSRELVYSYVAGLESRLADLAETHMVEDFDARRVVVGGCLVKTSRCLAV